MLHIGKLVTSVTKLPNKYDADITYDDSILYIPTCKGLIFVTNEMVVQQASNKHTDFAQSFTIHKKK